MARFEPVKKYINAGLPIPTRGTAHSAGYDLVVAEETVVPSYKMLYERLQATQTDRSAQGQISLDELAKLTKQTGAKPTLVSTGMKCYLDSNEYLELSVRSSTPLKYWLVLANSVGIIDADYADNETNDGELFMQLINLSPFDIVLHRGDKIGQAIIHTYNITEDDHAFGVRTGGMGSTGN